MCNLFATSITGGVSEAVSLTHPRRQQLFVPALLGLLSKGHAPRNRPKPVTGFGRFRGACPFDKSPRSAGTNNCWRRGCVRLTASDTPPVMDVANRLHMDLTSQ